MIQVNEAVRAISEEIKSGRGWNALVHEVDLESCVGLVLREDLVADRPHPPFHRVAMDGVAINHLEYQRGQRQFSISGCQRAGAPPTHPKGPEYGIEVMTGAVLPDGADTVIPFEKFKLENGIGLLGEGVLLGDNIHRMGADFPEGAKLVDAGTILTSGHIAVAATCGRAKLKVSQLPRIAIVSTGDEIVGVTDDPMPYQIRGSNVLGLKSLLSGLGEIKRFHIGDDPGQLTNGLKEILRDYDVLVLSGGVSEGKFDLVPMCLEEIGVKKIFHKINQKPGKPMWFGVGPERQLVFGLPGNPVSTMICAQRYVLPALYLALGAQAIRPWYAKFSGKDSLKKSARTYFCPVKVRKEPLGELWADPISYGGSGDPRALIDGDGFLEISPLEDVTSAANAFPLYLWRN